MGKRAIGIVQSMLGTRERLLRQGSNNSLRRLALMQALFDINKRKAAEDVNDKEPKKGVGILISHRRSYGRSS